MRLTTEAFMARLQTPADNDTLGGRIWRAREAMALSKRSLAEQLKVRIETVSAWESDRSEPNTGRLLLLAGVLGVTPAWLMSGQGEPPRNDPAHVTHTHLREQLAAVKTLHDQTAHAIAALEREIDRVVKDL